MQNTNNGDECATSWDIPVPVLTLLEYFVFCTMDLQEKIVEILRKEGPLHGRKIASLLESNYGIAADPAEVNLILYRQLKGVAAQNNNFEWILTGTSRTVYPERKPREGTSALSRLARYYLECLAKELGSGVSEFATSRYGDAYEQLRILPFDGRATDSIGATLVNKCKRSAGNLVFRIGYPLLLRRVQNRDQQTFMIVEPLFLFSVDNNEAIRFQKISLTDDDPQVNVKALESIMGSSRSSDVLLEAVEMYERLGLNASGDARPGYHELFLRLEQLHPHWNWQEPLNWNRLSDGPISRIEQPGIYNKAALFLSQRDKYTVGLERDLTQLAELRDIDYSDTALTPLLKGETQTKQSANHKILLEPLPLNEEQREAVRRGLSSRLTVITGPPGTGKSQVVASLIVNAIHDEQTVLFSSRNNKAVDVVYERVNGLSHRPVMLRLGSRFQTTLSEYLSGLLSAQITNDDHIRYQESKLAHDRILLDMAEVEKTEQHVIELRNKVDNLEVSVEQARTLLGDVLFAQGKHTTAETISRQDALIETLRRLMDYCDRKKQSIFIRLLWSKLAGRRLTRLNKALAEIGPQLKGLGLEPPDIAINEFSLPVLASYLQNAKHRNDALDQARIYFDTLAELNRTTDLFEASRKEKAIIAEMADVSIRLWTDWLQLAPSRMSREDRKVVGDYLALLNLIVASEESNRQIDRSLWARYYEFLPKIKHILPCWAVTSLSARGRIPLQAGFFDLVIIDEASQCDIASSIPLLYRAKRAVIIGDDKQLTHISGLTPPQDLQLLTKHQLDADFMGWSYSANSLFRLAASHAEAENTIALRDHHRSHADIIGFSNKFFYGENLRVATRYENLKRLNNGPAVRWLNVEGTCFRPSTGSIYNDKEVDAVIRELTRMVASGYDGTIGVVTPFHAQEIRIRDRIRQDADLADRLSLREFLCSTVHSFQGDERDVIVFSPVIAERASEGSITFLRNTGNLFNVAITRARAALIVVGDIRRCGSCDIPYLTRFIEYVGSLEQTNESDITSLDFGPKYPPVPEDVVVSEWEKIFYEKLYHAGIKTIPQVPEGQYRLDLALYHNGRKLDIEVDGEYYHRSWDGELLTRDRLRNQRMIELGWDVKRFWVYQIRDNMEFCIQSIKDWQEQVNP